MIANIIRPLKYRVQRSVLIFLQQNLTLCPSLYRTKQINWSEKNQTCFLLTKRANYKGKHSSQVSFPGGKKEENDNSLEETALRE